MKVFAKAVLGAALMTGAALAVASPAEARVGFSIGIGAPGPYYAPPPPPPAYGCNPYYYDCGGYGYDSYVYDEPVYWGGTWYDHPRYRYYGGRPEFFINGGWPGGVGFRGHGGFHGHR